MEIYNKKADINQVNLWLNLIALGLIVLIKIPKFITYSSIVFNTFDILTLVVATVGVILATLCLKIKSNLNKDTVSISCTAITLALVGLALLMGNEPIELHKNIYFIYSIVTFLVPFIAFSFNKVGLNIKQDETPDVRLNLIMSMAGAIITITLIVITNYISKKYYNDTLTIFIGSISTILSGIYSMIAAINIKKIRKGEENWSLK